MTRFFLAPKQDKETKIINKALKNKEGYHPQVLLWSQEGSLALLNNKLKHEDVIEIYAEGEPWGIGTLENSPPYDHSPFSLAMLFDKTLPNKDLKFTIELHCCNSGTIASGPKGDICFARDFSLALAQKGFINVIVKGYTGYVQAQRRFRHSVVSEPVTHGAKVPHCKLEEAEVTYQKGECIIPAKKAMVSYSYDQVDMFSSVSLIRYFTDKNAFNLSQSTELTDSATSTSSSTDLNLSCVKSLLLMMKNMNISAPTSTPVAHPSCNEEEASAIMTKHFS